MFRSYFSWWEQQLSHKIFCRIWSFANKQTIYCFWSSYINYVMPMFCSVAPSTMYSKEISPSNQPVLELLINSNVSWYDLLCYHIGSAYQSGLSKQPSFIYACIDIQKQVFTTSIAVMIWLLSWFITWVTNFARMGLRKPIEKPSWGFYLPCLQGSICMELSDGQCVMKAYMIQNLLYTPSECYTNQYDMDKEISLNLSENSH